MDESKLLSSAEFAKAIGVSLTTIKRWDKEGILRAYLRTPSGFRKYLPSQVDDYFAKYEVKENQNDH